ncbi:MAG: hypothetical protein II916_08990 [Oscillospiraceae bacterium]|nr:hypothetical protein [Oscillospiraceae bacterium]
MKKATFLPILLAAICLTGCSAAEKTYPTKDAQSSTQAATPEETATAELDVFADAVLNPNQFDNAYPASLTVLITSGDPCVGIDCTISEATPERIRIDAVAAAEQAASYLEKNALVLTKNAESYEIAPTEIKHYLLSAEELTPPVLAVLQKEMAAEFSADSLSPEAMYTVLPSPDTDYLADNTTTLSGSLRPSALDYKQYRLYIIFSDESGTYHVGYANPVFQNDGTLIHVNEQSLDYTRYGHLENETGRPDFESLETAYRAIETAYQPYADTLILTAFAGL